jgi:hypothetical protein
MIAREGWIFAAAVLAGLNVFGVVQLLPSGEEALPPIGAIAPEPPPPVYSVDLPEPAQAPKPRTVRPQLPVAVTISRPLGESRVLMSAPSKPEAVPKPKPAPEPPPAPAPAPAPAPVPEPAPAPAPEQPRTLALQAAPTPAPTGNRSPGRVKHKNGPPPGQAQSSPQAPQEMNPAAAEAVLEPNESPGREKHDNGLPPGQDKKREG